VVHAQYTASSHSSVKKKQKPGAQILTVPGQKASQKERSSWKDLKPEVFCMYISIKPTQAMTPLPFFFYSALKFSTKCLSKLLATSYTD